MSTEELKGFLGTIPKPTPTPTEPPKHSGVTVGKNLPANLHSLDHGHFKTHKKENKKKYIYAQKPPLKVHGSLEDYLQDLVPAGKKAEAALSTLNSKVEEAKAAMVTLTQDLKPGLMLGVDLAKPAKDFSSSLSFAGLKVAKAMSIPSEFFKHD